MLRIKLNAVAAQVIGWANNLTVKSLLCRKCKQVNELDKHTQYSLKQDKSTKNMMNIKRFKVRHCCDPDYWKLLISDLPPENV